MYTKKISVVLIFPLIIAIAWIYSSVALIVQEGYFWDLGIYLRAVGALNNGLDPYQLDGYLLFIYHPLVLHAMAIFGQYLNPLLILLYFSSCLFFIYCIPKKQSYLLPCFLAFSYCGMGWLSLAGGNLTIYLHLVLLGLLMREAVKSQSYYSFIIFVTIFSLIKPYFLIYLALPILAQWNNKVLIKKLVKFSGITTLIFVFFLVFASIQYGDEFNAFTSALKNQTIGKHDLGFGFVMFFYDYYSSAGNLIYRAFLIHFALAVIFLLIPFYLELKKGSANPITWPLLLYFLLSVFNPRLKDYDFSPSLIALLIYYFSLKQSLPSLLIFFIAYCASLTQLRDTLFFTHTGFFADPKQAYFFSAGLLYIFIIYRLIFPLNEGQVNLLSK